MIGVVQDDEVRRVEEEEEGARKVERARGEQREEAADGWVLYMCTCRFQNRVVVLRYMLLNSGLLGLHLQYCKIKHIFETPLSSVQTSNVHALDEVSGSTIIFIENVSFSVGRVLHVLVGVGAFPAAGLEFCAGALPLMQELGGVRELVDEVEEYAVGAGIVVA